jgi:hypothetical protein
MVAHRLGLSGRQNPPYVVMAHFMLMELHVTPSTSLRPSYGISGVTLH